MTFQVNVLDDIAVHEHGVSLKELENVHAEVSRRTLQRHLRQLIDQNKVTAIGEGPARRFHVSEKAGNYYINSSCVDLSKEAQEILRYVDKPLSARKPVGYQRELLEDYQPNETYYLPASFRQRLHALGNTGESHYPAGTFGQSILNRFLVDLSWASSRLEGNTYSKMDTIKLIEHGKSPKGKALFETQMILNHKMAIEFLVNSAVTINFDRSTIFSLHGFLSENLLVNPDDEGQIRKHSVEIGGSIYRPLTISSQLDELLKTVLKKCKKIKDPFEQALFIMIHLPYLQPFADVNKRTSRLAANIPFIKSNLCPLTFLHVSEQLYTQAVLGVYEMGRIELLRDLFVWAYERSTQEYIVIKQNTAQPSPMRLQYRNCIRNIIYCVVTQPGRLSKNFINQHLTKEVASKDREEVKSFVLRELKHLHEGKLARYGLTLNDLKVWQARMHKLD